MKFIISHTSLNAINTQSVEVLAPILSALEQPQQSDELVIEEVTFANQSLTRQGEDWVLEINDEAILKALRIYSRVSKWVAPLIQSAIALAGAVKNDMDELNEFLSAPKKG